MSPAARRVVALIALGTLQLLWFRWFFAADLPNSGSGDGPRLTRSYLLWRALPWVVPGLKPRDALLANAAGELSHVGNLPQRLPIVLAAALVGGAAVAAGSLAMRAAGLVHQVGWAGVPLAFGVGASALGAVTLLVGRLGLLSPWSTRAGLGAIVLAGVAGRMRDRRGGDLGPEGPDLEDRPPGTGPIFWPWLVCAPFVVVMLLGSMLPTIDFDSIEYHLQGPKEYFQGGRIAFQPHNVYASMPFGVEMLHLLGMEVLGDWWWGALAGQLLVAVFAPMAALMVAATAGRWGSPRAAAVGAVVYLATPWVYRLAVIPYVEGPLCFYHAALVYAAGRAWTAEGGDRARWWALAGWLAGGAMACKYPALISAVVPFGATAAVDALRRRSPRVLVAFGLGVVAVIGPWLAKNVVDTGNPVYPLGYGVFGGRPWDDAREAKWHAAHGPKPVEVDALIASAVDVAGRSDWQSPLYLALAPLAFLRRGSRRTALALAGFAAYLFLTWWTLTHRLDRFWLPLLPALAALAGLGADWTRGPAWSAILASVLAAGVFAAAVQDSTPLTGFNEWTGDLGVLRRRIPEMLNAPLARLDAELPPAARPLLVGQAAVFHMNRPVAFNTVFDREILEDLARDRTPDQIRAELSRRGLTHIYVDWFEIARYRSPGNYGFTDFIAPGLLAGLVASGVVDPPQSLGAQQELYRVRP